MKATLERIHRDALAALQTVQTEAEVEQLRIRFLGRKGELTEAVRGLREVPPAERPAIGAYLNQIKDEVERRIEESLTLLRQAERERRIAAERADVTAPGRHRIPGHLHPLTQTLEEIVDIFVALGFQRRRGTGNRGRVSQLYGALNVPADHPARDMQDTLFITDELRAADAHFAGANPRHGDTAAAAARHRPRRLLSPRLRCHPLADAAPGRRLYGRSARHLRRSEGRADTGAAPHLRRPTRQLRFRASFFPFTEPSAEVDIGCVLCQGNNRQCTMCKGSGWLEILGAGLIDPNVFAAVGYDPEAVSGFAFGLGVDRVTMLKYQINDIRLLFANDMRFLQQF